MKAGWLMGAGYCLGEAHLCEEEGKFFGYQHIPGLITM